MVPRNSSSVFTGREKLIGRLEACLLTSSQSHQSSNQKRFVLVGLGGTGKSEVCLKFAELFRER